MTAGASVRAGIVNRELFTQPTDPISEAASFWRAIYKVLLSQVSQYPDWLTITHEELCQHPIFRFQTLYQQLDLSWSDRVEHQIQKKTQGNTSAEAEQGKFHDFNRNSADILEIRRASLSSHERRLIFEIVQDVALQIYPRDSFAID